jgi:hypothetical protein
VIDPTADGAIKISALPVVLHYVRTLEALDGPLLAEFQSDAGDTFLYYWCDRDKNINRWLVVRTPTQDLTRYLVRDTTARDLILHCRDGFVYLVDADKAYTPRDVFFIAVDSLPIIYIPTERSYHGFAVHVDEKQQDVFISGDWDYQEVTTDYPRQYLQAYGFNALFGPHGDASNLEIIDYKLTQGYVFNTLFKNFRRHIRLDKRASLVGIAVASPGYVRFAVDPGVASDLRQAVAGYLKAEKEIESDINLLSRWASGRDEMEEARAIPAFLHLCTRMNLNGELILSRVDSVQTGIKSVNSYLNKLKYLANNDRERTAMLVGLPRGNAEQNALDDNGSDDNDSEELS